MGDLPGLSFDGVDDYVSIFQKTIQVTDDYSLVFVFKSPTPPSGSDDVLLGCIHEAGANDPGLAVDLNVTDGKLEIFLRDDNGNSGGVAWSGINLADNAWHILVITRDGATKKIAAYNDGSSMGTYGNDPCLVAQTIASNFALGAYNIRGSVSQNIVADMSLFRWYDRKLSAQEILNLTLFLKKKAGLIT